MNNNKNHETENDHWERLNQVIKWTGLSPHSFAMELGLKRSENIYRIKKGANKISKRLAVIITDKYSNINHEWLLLGIGEMLKKNSSNLIPFYDTTLQELQSLDIRTLSPAYKIKTPEEYACDFAIKSPFDIPEHKITAGTTLLLRHTDISDAIYQGAYLITTQTTCNYIILENTNIPTLFIDDSFIIPAEYNTKKCEEKIYTIVGFIHRLS